MTDRNAGMEGKNGTEERLRKTPGGSKGKTSAPSKDLRVIRSREGIPLEGRWRRGKQPARVEKDRRKFRNQ